MSRERATEAGDSVVSQEETGARERYSRAELIDLGGKPVTLNLGCGTDSRGIGVDLNYETADISADLNEGLPIEDDAVDRVIAEHVLEHLENPSFVLREIHRVLRPDGEATIEVPNAGWLPVRLYLTQDPHRFWEHKIPDRAGHWLARRLGNRDPDRTAHLTLWTPRLLADHLERAGMDYEFHDRDHLVRNTRVSARPAGRDSALADQTTLIHERDWETLIVLDSCRYDYFEALYPEYFEGVLRRVRSPVDPENGYATSTWCNGTFTERYDDITYLSTTLRINSRMAIDGFHAGERFDTVVDLWESGWNEAYGTVLPETVADAVRSERERDRTERTIVHYSQPHFPYLSRDPPAAVKDNDLEKRTTRTFRARAVVGSKVRHALGDGGSRKLLETLGMGPLNPMDEILRNYGPATMEEAYRENLEGVLESVASLVAELPGKTVITADHGELLGENGYYGHSYVPDHETVSTVPWLELTDAK
ncbi:MAG: methyltransferase domain-containing protein [Euryarchaeota archaeon]|jgi:predicted SAM-dependent methyltransferase|nr:methyltransferase domain-containing protein [Euryarchaeota archaeon]